jgi:hypothetical protein
VRTSNLDRSGRLPHEARARRDPSTAAGGMHGIAVSPGVGVGLDLMADPLRQKVYEAIGYEPGDMTDPAIDPASRTIFANPHDKTSLSVMDEASPDLASFKVTVLTPQMSQFAKLPAIGGRLMGRGGVQFLAKGSNNPKRSFYTFNFDEHITTDQAELDAMVRPRGYYRPRF